MSEINEANGIVRVPIDSETKEWLPGQDTTLPINGFDIPRFKEWISWNGFQMDKDTGMGHRGFDFASYLTDDGKVVLGLPAETPIRAVADGVIKQVVDAPEMGGGYVTRIHIEHGADESGMFSSYGHVVSSVENNQKVNKGEIIGTLYKDPDGEEGRLVHLHLELMDGWDIRDRTNALGGRKDPGIISGDIYKHIAEPQGNPNFRVLDLPQAEVGIANFDKLRVVLS